jgi:alginate O-acetyltransferase complex protein AlgI
MLFTSIEWVVFLLLAFITYHLAPQKYRRWVMLASSIIFYASWKWQYLGLLAAHVLVDWTCGILLGRTESDIRRKAIVGASVGLNLTSLGVFKFYGLISTTLAAIAGWRLPALALSLPLGISFFAFESMSYTVDVYRRKLEPLRSPIDLALFVTWFPHLIAGPIIRPGQLAVQLKRQYSVSRGYFFSGMELMLRGYAKKLLFADWLGKVADPIFAAPRSFTTVELIVAVYAYAFQIYCDFSAYTDIARGSSRWFGIELPENFDHPYESASITEFWHRWHMTLSHWLRDYLYFPLGGNRKGNVRTYANLMITMLLGGLWHGASWTFVVWGGLHGIFLAIERAVGIKTMDRGTGIVRLLRQVLTFHLVCFGWIFFRNPTFSSSWEMLRGIAAGRFWISAGKEAPILGAITLILLYQIASNLYRRHPLPQPRAAIAPQLGYAAGVAVFLLALMLFGATSNAFIYFQF